MTTAATQAAASAVPARAKRGAEAGDRTRDWSWAEAAVWTERMVSALENGVKGGRWPNAFFATAGLFALHAAWRTARHPR